MDVTEEGLELSSKQIEVVLVNEGESFAIARSSLVFL
jgi:hypothetical protein